ncbi:hypothetical protein HWV01_15760 [Moritella sp. 5]|uniref:hypothetical protein n=1 Tax=Moritella sp. 5 TaxID=2746231 RepID=UPI001BA47A19|nr:hypothetical protein [Moritella sp. 5]QUM81632.1 hypothetical protein HWV01_15760 [Moritella sp. 5]
MNTTDLNRVYFNLWYIRMKSLVLAIMVLLSFGKVSASEVSDAAAFKDLKKEVRMLRKDIRRLETLIIRLSDKIDDDEDDTIPTPTNKDVWGCYIKDITAGAVYGTGRTEAEAKGKALEKCELKGGACWESNLKCSSDNS